MNERVYYFVKSYDEDLPKPPAESFGQILNETYLHPFDWSARTTRKSYWWSVLTNFIIAILAIVVGFYAFNEGLNPGIRVIDAVVAIAIYVWVFLAGLGQMIRRLHDVGYSGYWYWAVGRSVANWPKPLPASVRRSPCWTWRHACCCARIARCLI